MGVFSDDFKREGGEHKGGEKKKSIGETFFESINDMLIVMCAFPHRRSMRPPRQEVWMMLVGKFARFSNTLYRLGTGKSLFAISSKI